jgi:cellulose synthase/poly-beta-1,6-N-acetylglucosamine synthase-like glycosyltransferase
VIELSLVIFEALRLALRAMLLVVVFHFLRAAWTSMRRSETPQPADPSAWPKVTVQLPLKNEFYVVERVIRAAAALDYPRQALDIQVLDDSTDETRERTRKIVDELRAAGHSIVLVTRDEPRGFKAGALNHGLESARGEFLAMFDADCAPPPDFLRRVIPHFADSKVGCVQVRWSFLNRHQSLLTRLQAIVLDGLFVVDQYARAESALPLQFNGTNGVWRRAAIEAAGGWNPEILAEDADLSFRAYLAGYRVVHLRDYAVPTEIPEDMAAFRAQQRRWALGSAQMLRALGLRILRAPIPARAKLMMFMHLGRHAIDPLILLACLTSPFTTLYGMPFLIDYGTVLNAGLVAMVLAGSLVFYGAALKRVRAPLGEVLLVPLIISLAIGLSLVYTVAFLKGIVSSGGAFERTPKAGDDRAPARGPRYRSSRGALAVVELALAASHVYFARESFVAGNVPYAIFFAAVAVSFGWVGLATLTSSGVGQARSAAHD